MATFILASGANFTLSDFFPSPFTWVVDSSTDTRLVLSVGARKIIVTGTGLTTNAGTISGMQLVGPDETTVVATITGLNLPRIQLESALSNPNLRSVDLLSVVLGGDDTITGDSGENELVAGLGNDTIDGGLGFDDLIYNTMLRTSGIHVEFTAEGAGTVTSAQGSETDIFTGIEAVHGTQLNDSFVGADGFQRFRGFGGNDTFDGGAGDDEVDYRNDAPIGAAGIFADLSNVGVDGYTSIVGFNGDTDKLKNIEFLRGTRNNDTIIGNGLNNRLRGDSGDDVLTGGAGNDTLDGGEGSDLVDYSREARGSGITVDFTWGRAWEGVSETPPGSGETDTLFSIEEAIGTDHDDRFIGTDSGEESFFGRLGSDTIDGGTGLTGGGYTAVDQINYNRGYSDAIALRGITAEFSANEAEAGSGTVWFNDGAGGINLAAGVDTFRGIERIRGTNGDDKFHGGAGFQSFRGLGGNDMFDGGAGFDSVDYRRDAGSGNTNGVNVDLAAGTATGANGDTDTLVNIEEIRGTDNNDTIRGDGLANSLLGEGGNDLLAGGLGSDTLVGGVGDDVLDGGAGTDYASYSGLRADYTFAAQSSGQILVTDLRVGGHGQDRVLNVEFFDFADGRVGLNQLNLTATTSAKLPDGVLNLIASGTANMNITGNTLGNKITGNAGINVIDGGAGNDVIRGGSGNDKLYGGAGADKLYADTGNDLLYGGADNDMLYGGTGINRLYGDAGNDRLFGGAGNDRLYGGAGKDIFVFDGNKPNRGKNLDTIHDYKAKDDSIWLDSKYLSKLGKGTEAKPGKLKKNFFVVGDKAQDKDDYLIYNKKTKTLYYDADGFGRGKAVEIFKFAKDVSAELKYTEFYIV